MSALNWYVCARVFHNGIGRDLPTFVIEGVSRELVRDKVASIIDPFELYEQWTYGAAGVEDYTETTSSYVDRRPTLDYGTIAYVPPF